MSRVLLVLEQHGEPIRTELEGPLVAGECEEIRRYAPSSAVFEAALEDLESRNRELRSDLALLRGHVAEERPDESEAPGPVEYWDCDKHEEVLTYTDQDDAIENELGRRLTRHMTPEEVLRVLGTEVTVYGFARKKLHWSAEKLAELVLEHMDDSMELGKPGDWTEPTPRILDAAGALLRVLREEYKVWTYECVEEHVIGVPKWVAENRPDWLDDPNGEQ